MGDKTKTRIYGFSPLPLPCPPLPLVESKCPPEYSEEKGWYYPEPDPDYVDPEITETDTYEVREKDEFWGYVTVCKSCGTAFQAYKTPAFQTRNYCPGCGKKLV